MSPAFLRVIYSGAHSTLGAPLRTAVRRRGRTRAMNRPGRSRSWTGSISTCRQPDIHESSQIIGGGEFHHHAVAGPRLRPRYHPGADLRCRPRHRRLFRRLQAAQPVAADLRRGGVFPGFRADPGRVQEPAGRGGDADLHRLRFRLAHAGAGAGHGARHLRRALGYLGHRSGLRRYPGKVRPDHRPAAGDLSLYIADLAVVPGRRDPQHLEPLLGAGLRADPAERRNDRLRAVPHALFRSAGHGAGLGGAGRRPVAASSISCRT